MTVPTRIEAAAQLISLDPPPWFPAHAGVAGVAAGATGWRAARIEAQSIFVERRSAAWLTHVGHLELARS